jgi:hypothetical protein
MEAAEARAHRLGVTTIETAAAAYRALSLRQLRDVNGAAEQADAAMRLAERTDIPHYQALSRAVAAWAAWTKGDLEVAVDLANTAIDTWAARMPAYPFTWTARTVLAAALVDLGRHVDAARALRPLGRGRDQALPPAVMVAVSSLPAEPSERAVRRCLDVAREHLLL